MMTEPTLGQRILDAADDWQRAYGHSDAGYGTMELDFLRTLCARADAAERLADDAAVFVERLLAVHEDGRYRLVWELAQNHMGPYQGPFYTAELHKLIATLAAWRAINTEVDG